jgi:hypothetical protein
MRAASKSVVTLLLAVAVTLFLSPTPAHATLLGPTPYVKFADSPFSGGSFGYFFLEDFEDHLFNTTGATASAGGVTSVLFGPTFHDSVDADDGSIDGSGLTGDSYFSNSGAAGITFTFDGGVLGMLPTSAGLVWTDGAGTTSFEAFDQNGVSLGSIGPVFIADGSFNGETADDRFFGATNAGGISRIFISNASGGIEVDHLQYGAIPEPGTLVLLATGLAGLGMSRRKRNS